MRRTLKWGRESIDWFRKYGGKSIAGNKQRVFGIVQGGIFADLRKESAEKTVKMGFDGYAIGGGSVGEPRKTVRESIRFTGEFLPEKRPRYVM